MSKIISIALAKGRLAEESIRVLERAGVDCDILKEKTRKLVLYNKMGDKKFILVKPADVPTYVERGAADIGIVGRDTLIEEKKSVFEPVKLNLAKCRVCVCGKKDFNYSSSSSVLRVATKYVNLAKQFFNKKGRRIEIIKLNGSVELAPLIDLSDVIVDVVESGKTLEENGLVVFEEIVKSYAKVIVNKASLKTKYAIIKPLLDKIEEVAKV